MEPKRPPITTIIICQDNASYIQGCLESVTWTEEIVAVDSGSTDGTLDILRQMGAKTFHKDWEGFRKQKEFAMNQATNDWVLEIDTDEFLSPELIDEIHNLSPDDWDRCSCFELPRLTFFHDTPVYHCGWFPDFKPRLYRRTDGEWTGINIHEQFSSFGVKKKLENHLVHKPPWDTASFVKRTIDYATIGAKDYHDKGRKARIIDLTLRPFYTFIYKFFIRKGFLDGTLGFFICATESFGVFLKYYTLLSLRRKR